MRGQMEGDKLGKICRYPVGILFFHLSHDNDLVSNLVGNWDVVVKSAMTKSILERTLHIGGDVILFPKILKMIFKEAKKNDKNYRSDYGKPNCPSHCNLHEEVDMEAFQQSALTQ